MSNGLFGDDGARGMCQEDFVLAFMCWDFGIVLDFLDCSKGIDRERRVEFPLFLPFFVMIFGEHPSISDLFDNV